MLNVVDALGPALRASARRLSTWWPSTLLRSRRFTVFLCWKISIFGAIGARRRARRVVLSNQKGCSLAERQPTEAPSQGGPRHPPGNHGEADVPGRQRLPFQPCVGSPGPVRCA